MIQDMVQEALAFLWALVLNNPRLLSTVTACNMEAPKASQCSSNHSQDWSAILVSVLASLYLVWRLLQHVTALPPCWPPLNGIYKCRICWTLLRRAHLLLLLCFKLPNEYVVLLVICAPTWGTQFQHGEQ